MNIEITADVVRVTEPVTFASGATKCELHVTWMETGKDGNVFEQVVPIEFWGDRIDKALTFNQGDKVKAECYLGGREYETDEKGKWRAFMSLRCARIEKVGTSDQPAQSLKQQVMTKAAQTNTEADDLPF